MELTPEQFNKLVTKDEFNRLEEKVDNLTDNVSRILTGVDGLAKKVDNFQSEMVANVAAHDRFEERITKLEKAPIKA